MTNEAERLAVNDLEEVLLGEAGPARSAEIVASLTALIEVFEQACKAGLPPQEFARARRIVAALSAGRRVALLYRGADVRRRP